MTAQPKLTLDVGPLLESRWNGIPTFTRRLVTALVRHGGLDLEFMYRMTPLPAEAVMKAVRTGSGALLRAEYEDEAPGRPDVPDRDSCFLYPSVKETFGVASREASTIHDVSTILTPEFHETSNIGYHLGAWNRQIESDEVVFCTSEATQAALTQICPAAKSKARVLHQYVDWPEHFDAIDRNMPPLALSRYAAVLGTIEPRKNHLLLQRVFETRTLRDGDLRFVVIGALGWGGDEIVEGLSGASPDRILFAGLVSDFIKYRLLKGAEFLVLPSFYEGFGIPALEAMSLGKPVLAARSSSLPEVVGDGGEYFDPLSVSEFADALAAISHPKRLEELRPLALQQSAAFTWRRMAAPVVEWVTGS